MKCHSCSQFVTLIYLERSKSRDINRRHHCSYSTYQFTKGFLFFFFANVLVYFINLTVRFIQYVELTWSQKINKKNAVLKLFCSRRRIHFFEINRGVWKYSCLQLIVHRNYSLTAQSNVDSLIYLNISVSKYMNFHYVFRKNVIGWRLSIPSVISPFFKNCLLFKYMGK